MRFLLMVLVSGLLQSPILWEKDFELAKQKAMLEHKFILLNFSGSDWCAPCIRLRKEILDNEIFVQYAAEELIMVGADFPRLKKNRLSTDQSGKNKLLADQFNNNGVFPLTLLLDASGRVLKTWEGLPSLTPKEFSNQVKAVCDANKCCLAN